ncbi:MULTISPECIES: ExbD/TolR family protein [Undibacterium]|jgi:biopolymer transport protein ExbD|uniref:Biopolymer transporter ExbD n=6 Tax=Undibacterium TaxID=401469 RepID=A0A923L071_9BURK|nr:MULTISPECIES: biopolymer transporter ExbD [Undibacterium]MBC3931859.1 biopolymer transporter ExbD [Undibacterium curvum]MBC3937250.1 biopolymer transporter ExbD [Undibacterium rugosum]MBR7780460.1 biopolymer transporter ExbD [Undibacterium rugosum]NDI87648.1 biopolymer transporter ExbD [Undibacterium crateris]
MAMAIGNDGDGEDEVNSTINTTPLVDVMLVLLIIFLITAPVITDTVKLKLPAERNQIYKTKPENITVSINKDGDVYWNGMMKPLPGGTEDLFDRLKVEAVKVPQPEVHIRGDQNVRYEFVGKTILTAQRAGIAKVGFVIEPPPRN